MKMPIEWHENNLKNQRAHYDRLKERIKASIAEARLVERSIFISEEQIAEAKRRGKDGFDAEKFLKKRGKQ